MVIKNKVDGGEFGGGDDGDCLGSAARGEFGIAGDVETATMRKVDGLAGGGGEDGD